MVRVLSNPLFRRLFVAKVMALAGTGLTTIALGLTAFALDPDNAGLALGVILTVKMVAYVFVAPVASAQLSKVPRKAVLVGADIVRISTMALLPLVTSVWQIYVLVFILQAASAVFTPTFQSLLPEVLPDREEYTHALSWSRLASDFEAVLSPLLAAALLVVVSRDTVYDISALCLVASAALILTSAIPRHLGVRQEQKPRPTGGYRIFWNEPQLRPVWAVNMSVALAGAFVLVQNVVIVRAHFGLGESAVALVLVANGVGSILMAIALPRLYKRFADQAIMKTAIVTLPIALLLSALSISATNGILGIVGIVLSWFLIGLAWCAAETPVSRLITEHVEEKDLPAAFAAQFSQSHACWLVGYALVGLLGSWSLVGTALLMAIGSLLAAFMSFVLWRRRQALSIVNEVHEPVL